MLRCYPRANLFGALLLLCVGCDDPAVDNKAPARPVTFMTLEESNPSQLTRLTGSVESWKKEMLSCRVSGRVTEVVEPGVNIKGRIIDQQGEMETEGTMLASLETDRYVLQRDEAKARFDLAKAKVKQAETELEQTIPQQIKQATAERDRRATEWQRQIRLWDQNATSKSDLEETENESRQADAILAQALALKATKQAELAALAAQVREAEQSLLQAEMNLDDCQLFSPFDGQIAKVHAIPGSFLYEGMPVVTVQMMDPVKVEVAVSQETDRRLRYNDQLNVYLDDSEDPISGFVYLKDTVADAATRTFNVTILVRNRRVEAGLKDDPERSELPRTTDLYNLEAENADGQPPFFTDEKSIHHDADGRAFVWKVEGLKTADLREDFDPVFPVKKVYVQPGERMLPILQLYRGRELADLGELDPINDLVTGQLPDDVKDGDKVFLSRSEWLMRPGQLVHVELKGQTVQPGFYVPRPAILRSGGTHYVFVAEDAGGGEEKARRVEVSVGDLIGDYRRIEAKADDGLGSGDKLILDGAHYLRDGDSINAFDEIEVTL